MIGQQISHYELLEKLGEGGMGVVYKARDLRLHRFVALKFLSPHIGPDDAERYRFVQEARAASALDHPNICTIHDIESHDGQAFIVMACYEGETLFARMKRGPLAIAEAIDIGRQIARALAAAHAAGIVHRDVKPANIFVTPDGTVKILDFGIARLLDETRITRAGTTIGTIGYMSPEQARGEETDQRADVWALGVILYEMLTGRAAFGGDHPAVVLQAIQSREPEPLAIARPDVPTALVAVVARALEKDRDSRFPNAGAMSVALDEVETSRRTAVAAAPAAQPVRKRSAVMALSIVAVGVLSVAGWFGYRSNRASWARNDAIPQISALVGERRLSEALTLAERAERHIPEDPVLRRLLSDISLSTTIETQPSGATVEIRPYGETGGSWRTLGVAPLANVRLPRGVYNWRFSKAGHDTIERAAPAVATPVRITLMPVGTVPDGMVFLPKGREVAMVAALGLPQDVELDDFYIGKFEVTNREFKRFVDAGGYRREEFWKHPFVADGRSMSWAEAMALFRDKANQPGPATWEVGSYPPGQDDLPVGGVSWFEAAAYAEFAGVTLPSIHHWLRAATVDAGPYLLPLANFDYRGPRPVGTTGAMSPAGTYDMAGNVKEWSWTATTAGTRYTLGGGWGEPQYMFGELEPRSPFDRSPVQGFRVAKYAAPVEPRLIAVFDRARRNFRAEPSASDDTFAQFLRMHRYPSAPLDARIEKTLTAPDGQTIVERATFTAPYPGERVIAYLWLPKDAKPPYQTVIIFPGADALWPATGAVLEQPDRYDFLVRSGRAVVHPVYRGMYERFTPMPRADPIGMRDYLLRMSQDFRRTLDYLATRSDLDASKRAYFGGSFGAAFGPLMIAAEPRVQLALFIGGGLPSARLEPEIDVIHYLPRVTMPALLLDGRYDFFFPYEESQKPFFERLGTPPDQKRHVTVEAAHAVPRAEYLRELLGWLDKYFGPAK